MFLKFLQFKYTKRLSKKISNTHWIKCYLILKGNYQNSNKNYYHNALIEREVLFLFMFDLLETKRNVFVRKPVYCNGKNMFLNHLFSVTIDVLYHRIYWFGKTDSNVNKSSSNYLFILKFVFRFRFFCIFFLKNKIPVSNIFKVNDFRTCYQAQRFVVKRIVLENVFRLYIVLFPKLF